MIDLAIEWMLYVGTVIAAVELAVGLLLLLFTRRRPWFNLLVCGLTSVFLLVMLKPAGAHPLSGPGERAVALAIMLAIGLCAMISVMALVKGKTPNL